MSVFQYVRSGEPVVIPAAAYNAMLDAAQTTQTDGSSEHLPSAVNWVR